MMKIHKEVEWVTVGGEVEVLYDPGNQDAWVEISSEDVVDVEDYL